MENDAQEVLSAFADGEPVATPRLLDALTRPGAHETLVELIRLRSAVEETERDPRPEFVRRLRARLDPARRPWWRRGVLVPAPALAAALACVLAAALLLESLAPGLRAPQATDVPPAPDRVLYFEEGVDWTQLSNSSRRF